MINLVIVDDDALIREGLKIIISSDEEVNVVASFDNGAKCIEYVESNFVDIVLLDMRMPIMNGIETLKRINKEKTKVVILTTFDEDEFINDAITYGANGYILKSSPPDKIISAVKSVMLGNGVYEGEIITKLRIGSHSDNTNKKDSLKKYSLTDREIEVITFIAKGYSNKEISNDLYISEGTVKNYITSILSKMNLKHRTQIAIEYLKS